MTKILTMLAVSVIMSIFGGASIGTAITYYKKGEYTTCGVSIMFALFFICILIANVFK